MDKKIRILLVEDNPGDARLIQEMLREALADGFELDRAERLSTGLSFLPKADVVLLDLGLPDSQGLDTVRTVHEHASHVPLIVLTGLSDESVGVMAVQEGAQDYLVKGQVYGSLLVRSICYSLERKRAENAQKESEARYRTVVDYSNDLIYMLDTQGNFTFVNKKAEDITGYKISDWIGKNFAPLVPPSDLPGILEIFRKTLVSELLQYEVDFIKKDGTIMTLSVNTTPIFEDGKVVGTLSFGRDITAKKRAEEALTLKNRLNEILLKFPGREMYDEVLRFILELTRSSSGMFGYIDEKGAEVVPAFTGNAWEKCQVTDKNIEFPHDTWANTIWGKALTEKRCIYVNEPFKLPEGHIPINRVMVVPILYQGEAIGNFLLGNKLTDYDDQDKEKMDGFANSISATLYARLQEERWERQRRLAEKALKESEESNRLLVDFSPFGIAIHSEGKLLYANLMAAKILGAEDPASLIGKPLFQIIHPDFHEIVRKRIEKQEKGNVALPLEEKFLRLDGSSVDVEVTSIPFSYMGKRGMYGVFQDITERKKGEEIQRKLSSAVENTADIVIIAKKDGTIEYVNPAFEKITGYAAEEAVGRTPRILKSGKQDKKFYEHLWGTILSGEVFYGVLINKKNNGELYITEKTITPIKDGNGTITHFISTEKDITERKKAEELRIENLRLEAADKAKSDFLASMSHELRTPLNSIIGFSEIMEIGIGGKLNEEQKHFVENISSSGKFLLSLINDILDLSKVEAGKIDLDMAKISVSDTINETLSLMKEKAMKHNVVLKTEFDPELEFIEADKQRVKQVLFNLLSNAVKFSKEDGGLITITAKKEGDMARFSVSDTGIGIKEENIGRLFRKFEQIEPGTSEKFGGTGLGLAISRQLVELHGGAIMAESKYGEGSTFTFKLPIEGKKLRP